MSRSFYDALAILFRQRIHSCDPWSRSGHLVPSVGGDNLVNQHDDTNNNDEDDQEGTKDERSGVAPELVNVLDVNYVDVCKDPCGTRDDPYEDCDIDESRGVIMEYPPVIPSLFSESTDVPGTDGSREPVVKSSQVEHVMEVNEEEEEGGY